MIERGQDMEIDRIARCDYGGQPLEPLDFPEPYKGSGG